MPAVVRVKRRIDEEPLSAFVLNGKRRRLEEDSASAVTNKEELSTLLKFAGTINEQDNTATTQFARLSKEEAKELVLQKTHKPINATEKARREVRQQQHEQRFRVVNCLRTTIEEDDSDTKSKEITIVDIEKHTTNDKTAEIPNSMNASTNTNNINLEQASTSAAAAASAAAASSTMPTDSDTGYVYDLYIPDNEQQSDSVDLMDDNYLSVYSFDDFIFEDGYNNEDNDDEYDSDDSNQENHFANDYPDEDDNQEDDMDVDDDSKHLRRRLEKFVFEDDDEENEDYNDSSSEDGCFQNSYRDPYVHYVDDEEDNYCYDVDKCDVENYNLKYARYKARILKKTEPQSGTDIEDIDNDSVDNSGTDEEDDS